MRYSRPFVLGSSQSYPQICRTFPSAIIKTETRSRKTDFVKHHTSRRLAHLASDPLLRFCAGDHLRAPLCVENLQSVATTRANQSHRQHTPRLSFRCHPPRIGPNGLRWTYFCRRIANPGTQSISKPPRCS